VGKWSVVCQQGKSAEKTEKALILAEVYRYKESMEIPFCESGFQWWIKTIVRIFWCRD
jgi:tellurite resistance protein TerA